MSPADISREAGLKFRAGLWYGVPASAAHELRRLAGTRIAPLVLDRAALARSR